MLDRLDLNQQMRQLGASKLSDLVGFERLTDIQATLGLAVNPSKMLELLKIRHGDQLFADKALRSSIIANLSPRYIRYVLDGDTQSDHIVSEDWDRIANLQWRRASGSTVRLIEIFDLPESYLPQPQKRQAPNESIEPEFPLFPHQRRVKDQAIRILTSSARSLLIHLPTGAGKTRIASEVIVDYVRSFSDRGHFVIWLAHSEELCEQAVHTISKIWRAHGDSRLVIHRLWGRQPLLDVTSEGGVIVAGLQRIHAMRTTRDNNVFAVINQIHRRCAMVLVDEAHKATAPTYRAGIEFLCGRARSKLIGLTATPGRGIDEAENADLVNFFEGNKLTITDDNEEQLTDPIGFLQSQQFLAKIERRKVVTEVDLDLSAAERTHLATYLDVPPAVLSRLAGNTGRNACILLELTDLTNAGKQVIAFACSVEHAHLLTELCMLRGIQARCIEGNTESSNRARYIEAYKHGDVQVLINFGVLTTGFDAPNTNAVLIARPTASIVLYSQMIGRGIRGPKVGGNEDCLLVDLEDNLIGFPKEQQAFRYFDNYWK